MQAFDAGTPFIHELKEINSEHPNISNDANKIQVLDTGNDY